MADYDPRPPAINFGRYSGPVDWGQVNQLMGIHERQRANAFEQQQQSEAMAQRQREFESKAQQEAIRLQGQMEYEELLKGGATPEEALRRIAHKLFSENPAGMVAALRATQPKPEMPTSIRSIPIMDAQGNILAQGVPGASGQVNPLPRPPSNNKREQLLPELRLQYKDVASRLRNDKTPESEKGMLRIQKKRIEDTMAEHGATMVPEPEITETVTPATGGLSMYWPFYTKRTPETKIYSEKLPDLPRPSALGKPSAPKEGALIRDKNTGKLYRVVNGEPVLIKE